ncbi:hypothetical protein L2E82_10710 [Cichorium intybus]|uniref:Uncharacterized protein n=1 Tax=Cichorium intybus TaxID=13427 RepID=A0ACB9GBF8_CICIN|nr:hypothetical protein L2E82_10710 [Cichorium intybus]
MAIKSSFWFLNNILLYWKLLLSMPAGIDLDTPHSLKETEEVLFYQVAYGFHHLRNDKPYLAQGPVSNKEKNGNKTINLLSLNDLLLHVTEGNHKATKNDAKRTRRNMSEPSGSFSPEIQCNETNPLLPIEMVEHLRAGLGSQGQILRVQKIDARIANLVEIPSYLYERTESALKCSGVLNLYSHQTESIEASLAGKNVFISTMTSSGKSLCYNLPVLESLSQDLSACALYLFPTKALARSTKSIVINGRRYVVVDEAHSYKGAFGCHDVLIIWRLRRLYAHVYGSDPSFIFCIATSANPREHTMELASLPTIELLHKDGSPSGAKLFVLRNPPLRMKNVRFVDSLMYIIKNYKILANLIERFLLDAQERNGIGTALDLALGPKPAYVGEALTSSARAKHRLQLVIS